MKPAGGKARKASSRGKSKKAAVEAVGAPKSRLKAARKAAPKARPVVGKRGAKASAAKSASAKATPAKVAPAKAGAVSSERARRGAAVGVGKGKVGRAPAKTGGRARPDEPHAIEGLSDEEQILAAKYLPRDLPPRLFEEERFLFPESYHVNRVRLLVKDPDWIFAYWDVDPKSLEGIGRSVGERAMALARLSLRVSDPQQGGSTDILLPGGARWWYVRTDSAVRSYRAELGVILPSGEFKPLAESNVVTTPRVGPSSASARRKASYRKGAPGAAEPLGEGEEGPEGGPRADPDRAVGPWTAPPFDAAASPPGGGPEERPARGGASDTFRPGGASDVHRR